MRICRPSFLALTCGLALGWSLLAVRVALADQIVVLIDEHGHKIYVNTGKGTKGSSWKALSFRPSGTPARREASADLDQLVEQTAGRLQIDPQLVHAIIQVESDYDPKAVSRKGALGLMQLVPGTARRFGVENPFDPKQNIEGGINYLRYLLDLFGNDLTLSLAAYNAGENSVLRRGGIPSIPETRDYVRRVTTLYRSGSPPKRFSGSPKAFNAPSIRQYVDAQGVVHFTNVD